MPKKGFRVSEETKRKISKSTKGEKNHNWGKKASLETRRKQAEARSGKCPSLETRRKMSEAHKGVFHSEKSKKKMSEKRMGKKNPMYGRNFSKKHRERMSKARSGEKNSMYGRRGESCPSWCGGKSFELYSIEFNNQLKEFIRKRDKYRCQECFRPQDELFSKSGKKYKLDIHHIDYNKKNNNPKNLLSLCRKCHAKANYKRNDWTKHFKEMITK